MRRFIVVAVLLVAFLLACGSGTAPGSSGSSPSPEGGTNDCTMVECFAANECRKGDCNGEMTSSGCCPCPAGYVDNATCPKDASVQKTDCTPACAGTDICVRPGACMFDARCVAQAEVTCPDSGLCNTTGCAGELKGNVLTCTCR